MMIINTEKISVMKAKHITSLLSIVIFTFILSLNSCKDDPFNVPAASTQADFVYTIEELVIDEEEEIVHFKVSLTNKSILAQSYLWDFGNGETSTEENPTVIYTASGRYNISLTVSPQSDVYYNKTNKTVSLAFGKQVLLFEDFSAGVDYLDEDEWAPEGWKIVDSDGDGFNWYVGVRQEVFSMRSQSYAGSDPLTPDNWLILPEIDLTQTSPTAAVTFRYNIGITANTPRFRLENYGVFISVGSDNLESFELLRQETFTEETPNWTAQERTVDISKYAGEIVFLAIRHYNVSDMDRIFVEEVEVYLIE